METRDSLAVPDPLVLPEGGDKLENAAPQEFPVHLDQLVATDLRAPVVMLVFLELTDLPDLPDSLVAMETMEIRDTLDLVDCREPL